ncbi:putative protein family UPF0150 [Alkalidesulfovibrio alkalitolerans DSM 16529]|jgi:antitoxin HicB|uniref:HicB-like antitoxin of toxin-antitoxin system domain-containing protein n=1 Tax=Alkalidesulfovibrio alkalitolerans DSM 16529 TaxID=1121439 RepID=S7UJ63_9BACT|nr:type II toxin-antitoxin system HicB family antitoxin [Alkalidesulfovibrio alkalitolerans]EPR32328.1 putative protein family UPF0150 [Alkalidesulfovibrio alkalitolerans DSM 16529]
MLAYPIELTPDDNGTLLVTCPDLPEVVTFGEDEADALMRAVSAVEEALAARIAMRDEIPLPSPPAGRPVAALPALTALKTALYQAMRESGTRKADLARRLSAHGPQVDRLLDLRHASRLDQIEAAFRALGKRIDFQVRQ